MDENVTISNIMVSSDHESNELSALVDGDRVFIRVPGEFDLLPAAECFIGIALLEAMISNRDVVVKGTSISRLLSINLAELQSIYSCWNPDLSKVAIHAETTSDVLPHEHVGSCFSAGVDSTFTLLRHFDKITHMIFCNTFDDATDRDSWKTSVEKQTRFAQSIGKKLIPIESNAREWTQKRKIAWEFVHGPFLSTVGNALGMRTTYIPSSHTYNELFPWGSHPVSDPLWRTESTEVIHDSAGYRRGEKTKQILTDSRMADNLQTCWRRRSENCGTCPKCARSILAIYLLGGKSRAFPSYQESRNILTMMKPTSENDLTFLEDAMILAKNAGHEKIYRTLMNYHKRYQMSLLFPIVDRCLLNNAARTLYRKLRKPDWLNWRVTMRGAHRNDM